MPPKKQPDKKKGKEDEPSGYDIDIMILEQLKQYARLLEDEIEDMRRHCNFYEKAEDELFKFLKIAEDDLKYGEEVLLFKDVELEKMKLNILNHLREKSQLPKYMEHKSSVKKQRNSSEISALLEKEQNRHFVEIKKLKSLLLDKNRELEALKCKVEISRRETKERNEECLRNIASSQKKVLEQTINTYADAKKNIQDEFNRELEIIKLEVKEGRLRSERNLNNACLSLKQKLQNYYKEATKQDLQIIKSLKNTIEKTEERIKKSKSLLEKAKKEIKETKHEANFNVHNRNKNTAVKFDTGIHRMNESLKIHNKTEKLFLDNQNLEKQIKDITIKIINLKMQFTAALGKVRKSAEMKVEFLENKVNFSLDGGRDETVVASSVPSFKEY